MSVRWVVRHGDGETVSAIVARAGGDALAIAEGRVFVGRRRAKNGEEAVRAGDEVRVEPAAKVVEVRVIASDAELVVVDKPAGIPTIPDHAGSSASLLASAARAVGVDASALHPTSRLDREVSGVVVFARTKRAAEALARAREEGTYERRYVAVASRAPARDRGTWNVPIGRASDPRHRMVNGRDAVAAETRFRVVARAGDAALVALTPITGRTHQLRVHAAHAGAPLFGDRTYGGPRSVTLPSGKVLALDRVMLHAARVAALGRTFASPIPQPMRALWESLGGDTSAWDTALACDTGE